MNNNLRDLLKVWDTSIRLEIDSNKVYKYYNRVWKYWESKEVYSRRSNFSLCLAQKAPSTLILTDFTIYQYKLWELPYIWIVFFNKTLINENFYSTKVVRKLSELWTLDLVFFSFFFIFHNHFHFHFILF